MTPEQIVWALVGGAVALMICGAFKTAAAMLAIAVVIMWGWAFSCFVRACLSDLED